MSRSQFTFYASFASALSRIKKKADRADAYDAICNYALFGTEPDLDKLPDSAAIAFDLIRPTLDASKRKSENGKAGANAKQTASKQVASCKQTGSKPLANAKLGETASEKEKEIEKEKENENEIEGESPIARADVAAVMTAYMNRIEPFPSPSCCNELIAYVDDMGQDCCLRAIQIAEDNNARRWSYIRSILRDKHAQGVRNLEQWDALEAKRQQAASIMRGRKQAAAAVQESSEWAREAVARMLDTQEENTNG